MSCPFFTVQNVRDTVRRPPLPLTEVDDVIAFKVLLVKLFLFFKYGLVEDSNVVIIFEVVLHDALLDLWELLPDDSATLLFIILVLLLLLFSDLLVSLDLLLLLFCSLHVSVERDSLTAFSLLGILLLLWLRLCMSGLLGCRRLLALPSRDGLRRSLAFALVHGRSSTSAGSG